MTTSQRWLGLAAVIAFAVLASPSCTCIPARGDIDPSCDAMGGCPSGSVCCNGV